MDKLISKGGVPQLVEDMNAHEPDVALFPGGLVAGSDSLETHVLQWDEIIEHV